MAAIAADEEFSSDSEADVADDGVAEDGVGNAISPKPIGKKVRKRKSRFAGGTAKKAKRVCRNLEAASGADGLIQSIFVEGVCIPMWPQYVDRTNPGRFIRIGTQEAWVNQFMVALRKAVVPREKTAGMHRERKKWTRHFVKCVCDEVLQEFKTAKVAGRGNLKPFDRILTILIGGCDVIASTNTRCVYIQATEKSAVWIQSGFSSSVKAYLDRELRAMSHNLAKGADDLHALVHNMRDGVREKVTWMPENCTWHLNFKGTIGDDLKYCKTNNINLAISRTLRHEEFQVAREHSFLNALRVWNAVDTSKRKRIAIPERRMNVQMVLVPQCEAMSHSDSDRESGDDDREQ